MSTSIILKEPQNGPCIAFISMVTYYANVVVSFVICFVLHVCLVEVCQLFETSLVDPRRLTEEFLFHIPEGLYRYYKN